MNDSSDFSLHDNVEPTTEKSKSIHAINKQTVHQICSGQVVLNLATAVKELVENSLDAGATAVEIRLKDYGKESVEVTDNGYGVEEDNFQALTLKHHTSKLRDYSDLIGVSTFGFRGEALSSLCALSNLIITTRHKSVEIGTRIEFDHNGIIVKKSPCARQVGTTIQMTNLFCTLPVRQKEFHKNIKREFNKMTQLLYAYCLVACHAKITCSNQNKGVGRTVIVSTQGNKTLRDNIVSVFGSKQVQHLLDIKPLNTYITQSTDSDINGSQCKKTPFHFEGVISSCAHDSGRSASDRQFFYVNSRPCEPTKVMKVVNEIYKQFNTNQSPFVFLNIKVEHCDVDVNVTPDKRQIFLNNEKLLVELLKQTLTKLFENIPSTLKLQNKSLDTSNFNQTTFLGNSLNNIGKKSTKVDSVQNQGLKRKISFLERFASNSKNIKLSCSADKSMDEESISNACFEDVKTPDLSSDSEEDVREKETKFEPMQSIKEEQFDFMKAVFVDSDNEEHTDLIDEKISRKEDEYKIIPKSPKIISVDSSFKNNPIYMAKNVNVFHEDKTIKKESCDGYNSCSPTQEVPLGNTSVDSDCEDNEEDLNMTNDYSNEDTPDYDEVPHTTEKVKDTVPKKFVRSTVEVKCSLEDVKSRMKQQSESNKSDINKLSRIKFRSEILPSTNEAAEKELDREISKDMFSKMVVLGQFNLGFIIVKLDDDLFIIDQHASDEKYNFENLQKTTVLQNQKLVIPQTLELTAMNESILIDNMEVFERNGFQFEIDGSADTTKRVKLIGIPMSKNIQFGKEDIDELLFMLQDSSGDDTTCRPSRVRSMLASRACRKSVMVGTPMTRTDMKKLVENMGTMDQPWNCPHGRPTMRHLINLYLLNKGTEE